MALRQPAPDRSELLQHMLEDDAERFKRAYLAAPFDDSRYMHWSELIRRTPPEGFTHKEWWFQLKEQRRAQMRSVPLYAKDGTEFRVALTDEVLQLSDEIARRAGGSVSEAGQALTPRGRNSFIIRGLMEEAIASSQLEGASTSRRVAQEMLDSGRAPADKSEKMILNNFLAMQQILVDATKPLTPERVRELHITLTSETLEDPEQAGRLERPEDERVRVWAYETCVHEPPPAVELPGRLKQLCAFANGTPGDTPYLPPVVRAIITHFMFGYDHYFADGNGRTARIAFYWAMLHNGYWLAEFLAISKILRKAHGKYGDSYQYTEDDEGDLTYFVRYQLRVIRKALDELDEHIESKRDEARAVQSALRGAAARFSVRQTQMIEWFAKEDAGAVQVNQVARRFRVSTPTARADLTFLENEGLLIRGASKRPVTWIPVPDFAQRLGALKE